MNKTTIKRVIKRQFNMIIDEENKLRRVLEMETNDEHPEALFSGFILELSNIQMRLRLQRELQCCKTQWTTVRDTDLAYSSIFDVKVVYLINNTTVNESIIKNHILLGKSDQRYPLQINLYQFGSMKRQEWAPLVLKDIKRNMPLVGKNNGVGVVATVMRILYVVPCFPMLMLSWKVYKK